MCSKCGNKNLTVVFPGVNKQCTCNCTGGGSSPPNPNYLIKPEGGEDGDILVKNGENVIWVNPHTLHIEPIYSTQITTI